MSDSVRPHRPATQQAPPIPGILQARTLEWGAISFSNASKWRVKVKSLSCVQLLATPWTAAYQAPPCMGFSRQEYWSGVPLPSPRGFFKPLTDNWGHSYTYTFLDAALKHWFCMAYGKLQECFVCDSCEHLNKIILLIVWLLSNLLLLLNILKVLTHKCPPLSNWLLLIC